MQRDSPNVRAGYRPAGMNGFLSGGMRGRHRYLKQDEQMIKMTVAKRNKLDTAEEPKHAEVPNPPSEEKQIAKKEKEEQKKDASMEEVLDTILREPK